MTKPLLCPLLKKPCIERDCMFWTHMQGEHPQTGAKIDTYDCAFKWLPVVALETSRRTVGVQAAIESMRNEVVERQDTLNAAIATASQGRLGAHHEGSSDSGVVVGRLRRPKQLDPPYGPSVEGGEE